MPFYFNGPLPGEAQESASVQSQQSVSEARRSGQKNVEQKNSDNLFAQHFSAHKNKSQVQSHVPRSPAPSPGSHTCRAPPHPPRERPHRMTGTVAVISMPQITRPSMLPILLSFLPCGACHLHCVITCTCLSPALVSEMEHVRTGLESRPTLELFCSSRQVARLEIRPSDLARWLLAVAEPDADKMRCCAVTAGSAPASPWR